MRARVLAIAMWAGLAASTAAMPYFPPPTPIYEAPIDRALENVGNMQGLEPAQRERLLGRLNLLAYARDDSNFAYQRDDNQLNEGGSMPCSEVGPGSARVPDPPPQWQPNDLCAHYTFDIRPQNELPDNPTSTSARGLARLEAARTHYAEALRLDPSNLRARLGYAYVFDRLGQTGDARRELRAIIRYGLPKLKEDQSNWEDHAVLTEAAAHLDHLATSHRDRARLARVRARLDASHPMFYVTPIMVPLTDAPFGRLVDDASPVSFDFAGTGDERAQGWITPSAAWLVWDPEWRGNVRSGFDMIGQRSWAVFWSDGFEALRALDDNRDGELTGGELGGLSLWRDENSNGVSEPGEVVPANVHGSLALSVRGTPERPGQISNSAGVRFDNARTRPLYDWTPGLERSAPSA
jgi:hypothetical protein